MNIPKPFLIAATVAVVAPIAIAAVFAIKSNGGASVERERVLLKGGEYYSDGGFKSNRMYNLTKGTLAVEPDPINSVAEPASVLDQVVQEAKELNETLAQTKKQTDLLMAEIYKHLENDNKAAISVWDLPQAFHVMDTNITIESEFEPVVTHTTNGWEVRFKE